MRFTKGGVYAAVVVVGLALLALPASAFPQAVTGGGKGNGGGTGCSTGTSTGLQKGDGSGGCTPASAGTDYVTPNGSITGAAGSLTGSVPATQVTGLALSATTDTTNAGNIGSGTLNAARLPASGVASQSVAGAQGSMTVDALGRITALAAPRYVSWTFGCYDDSYGGSGATTPKNGYCHRLKRDVPTMTPWLGDQWVPSTRAGAVSLSVLAGWTPNATYPSTVSVGPGGENEYTWCNSGSAACVTDFSRFAAAAFYWAAVAPQQRTLMSNVTTGTGTCTANTTLAPVNATTGNVAGSATSCAPASTKTFTIPTTATTAGLYVYVPTGTATTATYTVSIDGTLQTDSCSGTTTFTAIGCNPAGAGSNGVQRLRFPVTAGTTHPAIVTMGGSTNTTLVAWDYTTATPAANTNAVLAKNAGAAFDITGWTATAQAAVVALARTDALPVMTLDTRAAMATIADGSTGGGVGATFSPVYGAGTAQNSHPRDAAYLAIEQAALQTQVANNYIVSVIDGGASDPDSALVDATLLQQAIPSNCNTLTPSTTTWASCYRNYNTTADYTNIGWLDFSNIGRRIGSGSAPGRTGSVAYTSRFMPAANGDCVQSFTTSGVTSESNFANVDCGYANGDRFGVGTAGYNLFNAKIGTALAAQATIAPVAGVTHISSSTAAISTITPPAACTISTYACTVTFIPDVVFTTVTGGNIAISSTAVVSRVITFTRDPATSLWYPSY